VALFNLSTPVGLAFITYRFVESQIEHSNVRIPMGPLKWIMPSPWYHQWHHALDEDAQNKNFSPYPMWDLLFGTAFMPANRLPSGFGVNEPVPTSYLGQMTYPFGLAPAVERARRRAGELLHPRLPGALEQREHP
jgi:sterol desaturase/sphingolipid hydroxylase (fatty acid hydroxylase superfamily)